MKHVANSKVEISQLEIEIGFPATYALPNTYETFKELDSNISPILQKVWSVTIKPLVFRSSSEFELIPSIFKILTEKLKLEEI